MSLLLDALNRASKEKQKAAAAALGTAALSPASAPLAAQSTQPSAQAVSVVPPLNLSSDTVEPLKWAEIPLHTLDPEPTAAVDTPRSTPPGQFGSELALTLVDVPPGAAPESMTPFERPRQALASGVMSEMGEPTLEPGPAPLLQAAPAFQLKESSAAPPVAQVVAQPEPISSTPLPPTLDAAQAPAQPAPPVSPPVQQPPSSLAPALAVKAVPNGERAQDIRRAYEGPASDARKGRRRVMALGGLATGLALAFGSVLLGLWGDPAKWIGGSGLSTVTPPIPVVVAESAAPTEVTQPIEPVNLGSTMPAVAPPPTVAATPAPRSAALAVPSQTPTLGDAARQQTPTAAASVAATPAISANPSSNTSTSANGNEVLLSANNARTNPHFVAKIRGPSALEYGYALLLEGRLDDAASAYGQALRVNADERDALLGLAYISQQKGQREDAQSYYRSVLRQEPNNARALAAMQALDVDSGPTLTASRTGDLAARQPDSAAAMAMAGNAFVRDGLLSNAAQAYARAQALEPANPLHAYNHAVALDRLGQYAQAVVQYERVLALSATAPVGVRVYRVEDVRLRYAQLRQALAASTQSAAP